MKANDGQCLILVSFSASYWSAVVLILLDRTLASPSLVPSQQCWYSFADECTEANRGK